MTDKISINGVSIKKYVKDFTYKTSYGETIENEENKKECELKIEEFKKKNLVTSVKYTNKYNNAIEVSYYSGNVEFEPVKEGDSSIKMDINLTSEQINAIIVMCLDNVCGVCEKQTRAFQDTFVNFVKDNSEALTNQTEKIKKGLLARSIDKVLTIKDSKNDK
jgi:hypothetical protein